MNEATEGFAAVTGVSSGIYADRLRIQIAAKVLLGALLFAGAAVVNAGATDTNSRIYGPVDHWQGRRQVMPLAELPIWKTVRLDTRMSAAELRGALNAWPFRLGDSASAILEKALAEGNATSAVNLVVLSASEMGFEEENVRLSDFYARARELGLELCPAVLGPLLRLQFLDQRLGDFVHIAMKPIATHGDLIDFTVANGGAGLLLIGGEASPERIVAATMRFVFVVPASTAMNPTRRFIAN
jgi:hypothetical protein